LRLERGWFAAPALPEPFALIRPKARFLNIGSVIDAATRSVPLILEVQNDKSQLRIGLQGDLSILTGDDGKITVWQCWGKGELESGRRPIHTEPRVLRNNR
jgi:multidrug efflux pump subunit AcrA (membrane-fusion protein)